MTTAPISPPSAPLSSTSSPSTDGALPGAVGELAHAAFYAAIQQRGSRPGGAHARRPGTRRLRLSPLYGYWRSPQDRTIHVNAGQPGWLRVCLLDDRLFPSSYATLWLANTAPPSAWARCPWGSPACWARRAAIPWCGYTTLDDAAQPGPPRRDHWVLQFESPTAIRWGEADNRPRRVELFPAPRMAVASLRTRWDRLTGDTWGLAFEEWVERNVVVGHIWQWRTETFPFQKQRYMGGVGKLEYRVLDGSQTADARGHLNRLLHLAFYTGIGYKTTHGLGQVRVVSPES